MNQSSHQNVSKVFIEWLKRKPEKQTVLEKFFWHIVYVFALPLFIIAAFYIHSFYAGPGSFECNLNLYGWGVILWGAIIGLLYKVVQDSLAGHQTTLDKRLDEFTENHNQFMSKAQISFDSPTKEFDDKHLLAYHRILEKLDDAGEARRKATGQDGQQKHINIYAIDNSDARSWWTDTMIGYLGIISKHHYEGRFHRIFVCKKYELLSPLFAKTIGLHSLMGFKTYVIEYDKYIEILKSIRVEGDIDIQKEVLIWTESSGASGDTLGTPFGINFELEEFDHPKKWKNVKCYQSFWNADSDYNIRKDLQDHQIEKMITNYYGRPIKTKDISIWFEFIAKEKNCPIDSDKYKSWKEIPEAYICLIDELLKKMVCCKEPNEIPLEFKDFSGIEIRTSKTCTEAPSCSFSSARPLCPNKTIGTEGFDFTSMSRVKLILQEYHDRLTNQAKLGNSGQITINSETCQCTQNGQD